MTTLSPEAWLGGRSVQSVWRFTETAKSPAFADVTASSSERMALLTPAPQSYPSTTMVYCPPAERAFASDGPAARRPAGERTTIHDTSKVPFMNATPFRRNDERPGRIRSRKVAPPRSWPGTSSRRSHPPQLVR